MNAKAVGAGVVILLGVGGFLVYDEYQKKQDAKARTADRAVDAAKAADKVESAKRPDPKWATVPNLRGKSEADAATVLREAGFADATVEVLEARFVCEYEDNFDPTQVVAQGAICDQDPDPGGRVRAERFAIRVVLEHDTFEHGGLSTSEWRRMPEVTSMSLVAAQAALAAKGFGPDEFEVEDYTGSCSPGLVCETVPKAGLRKRKDTLGTIRASLK